MRKLFVCTVCVCAAMLGVACRASKSTPTSASSVIPAEAAASDAPGDGCVSSDALAILTCERNKYDHMTADQETDFVRASAVAFRRSGIAGGPFGILRKTSGTNCNGYACDVLCAGQGESQVQWDVLTDGDPWPNGGAQTPRWGSPAGYPDIRVDSCELQ